MSDHTCTSHQPGSPSCYRNCACRCDPCSTAEARRSKACRAGLHGRIPADLSAAHLRGLLDSGMARGEISRVSGISDSTVSRILDGHVTSCTRHTTRALLAVQPSTISEQQSGWVDATGTRRRLQALIAIGWPQRRLGRIAGLGRNSVGRLLEAPRCTAAVRAAVADMYDRLWNTTPQEDAGYTVTKARALAARRGWLPPLAWDSIDDPDAKPYTAPERRRTHDELAAEVEHLLGLGEAAAQTIRQLGFASPSSLASVLRRSQHPRRYDLAQTIERAA